MRRDDLAEALDVLAEVAEERLWLGVEPGFDRAAREASSRRIESMRACRSAESPAHASSSQPASADS